MAYHHDIYDELHVLKDEAARLLSSRSADWRAASGEKTAEIAADIKTFLSDFREAIAVEDEEIERLVAGHATVALASALAAGFLIGWVLGRKL